MLNRWLGIASVTGMLAVNGALVLRDVLPRWAAGEPPESSIFHLQSGDPYQQQLGIYARDGRVGTAWTKAQKNGEQYQMYLWTWIKPLDHDAVLPSRLLVRTDLFFDANRRLDTLHVVVTGLGTAMNLDGNFVEPNDFACTWHVGKGEGNFILPGDLLRVFSDATRPFESLPNLHVGQTWRMQVFNPLAGLLPGGGGAAFSGGTMVAQVVGQENLFHAGRNVNVFIVEADRARAWVAADGRVLRQEIELPVLGSVALVDEEYDDDARQKAVQESRE